jgi:hypothetical protein
MIILPLKKQNISYMDTNYMSSICTVSSANRSHGSKPESKLIEVIFHGKLYPQFLKSLDVKGMQFFLINQLFINLFKKIVSALCLNTLQN